MGFVMIEKIWFELYISTPSYFDWVDFLVIFAIQVFFILLSAGFSYSIFKVLKIGKKDENYTFLPMSILLLPPILNLLSISNIDFLNEKLMAKYANGNYKYSKIMKYCIIENEQDYAAGGIYRSHDSVRGMVLCFIKERDAFIDKERTEKSAIERAEKMEQIRKQVR